MSEASCVRVVAGLAGGWWLQSERALQVGPGGAKKEAREQLSVARLQGRLRAAEALLGRAQEAEARERRSREEAQRSAQRWAYRAITSEGSRLTTTSEGSSRLLRRPGGEEATDEDGSEGGGGVPVLWEEAGEGEEGVPPPLPIHTRKLPINTRKLVASHYSESQPESPELDRAARG